MDSDKVSLDSDKPLGLIAQDPVQHDPFILSMNKGPITQPCIDTFLCNPGTSMEHISIDREDESTSRLQENITNDGEAFKLEASIPLASLVWANDGGKSHPYFSALPKGLM